MRHDQPPRYAELHCKTGFSFLEGASHPEELIGRALELGLSGLAITDQNGLYGVVEAREALLELSGVARADEAHTPVRLIYGSELTLSDGDVAVLIARDLGGYHRLAAAITRGRRAAEKGQFRLSFADLVEELRGSGMSGGVSGGGGGGDGVSGGGGGGVSGGGGDGVSGGGGETGLWILAGGPRSLALGELVAGRSGRAMRLLGRWREAFGDAVQVELCRHLAPGDRERSQAMAELATRAGLPLVATNDVVFHRPEKKPLHDLLRCVAAGVTLAEAGRRLLPNAEPHLKPAAAMAALFADRPEAVARAAALADAVTLRLTDVRYTYPPPALPPGETADSLLARLARAGLEARLGPAGAARHAGQLERELQLIAELDYAGYFLTMWDVVQVCKHKRILCQGRGSAANSLTCFGLGITSVAPDTIDMLFERFISRERNEPPDIDLDIEHERREEVIQHVYQQYGRDHAAMVAEVIRYRFRSAVREAGKALGFSEEELGRMSKFLTHGGIPHDPVSDRRGDRSGGETHRVGELDRSALAACGVDPDNRNLALLLQAARAMIGLPRHLSIHVGGFVLSDVPLGRIAPIENGRMPCRTVIQWAKDDIDAMGMFKLDLLGLGMLTVLARAFALIEAEHGVLLGLETVPAEDPATYQMLRAADTVGVFQVESRAQMNMLPRLEPHTFYDLVVEVAIVRPGPIQGKMVHPYLRRRRGLEPIEYPHPRLEAILSRTLGVPLFQEQVMRLAEAVGGYTAGEADQLRRDMASWRAEGKMQRHRERLIAGMRKNGLSGEYAERVFQQIRGVRLVRVPRVARGRVRAPGLCVGLPQVPLPARVCGGAPELAADGVLQPGGDPQRRQAPRRPGAAAGCAGVGLGLVDRARPRAGARPRSPRGAARPGAQDGAPAGARAGRGCRPRHRAGARAGRGVPLGRGSGPASRAAVARAGPAGGGRRAVQLRVTARGGVARGQRGPAPRPALRRRGRPGGAAEPAAAGADRGAGARRALRLELPRSPPHGAGPARARARAGAVGARGRGGRAGPRHRGGRAGHHPPAARVRRRRAVHDPGGRDRQR